MKLGTRHVRLSEEDEAEEVNQVFCNSRNALVADSSYIHVDVINSLY
jgi:hypothetical protein